MEAVWSWLDTQGSLVPSPWGQSSEYLCLPYPLSHPVHLFQLQIWVF